MDKNIYIDNCEYSFEYKCPLKWKNLKRTNKSKIRFCDQCNKNVYLCKTDKNINKNIKLNNCIAIDGPDKETMTMGIILQSE